MATMTDVARQAGVSVTTVSHVVNGTRSVRPQTRERVEAAIAATGFRRNALASALVTSRTRTLGVCVCALSNPYFAHLLRAIEIRGRHHGFAVVLRDTHDDPSLESDAVDGLLAWQVDGLLVAPAPGVSDALSRAVAEGIPVVLIDRQAPLPCDQVAPDNVEPAGMLLAHLANLGHERIAVLTGLEGLQSTDERADGVEAAAAASGTDIIRLPGASDTSTAHDAVLDLFSRSERPRALVSLNNAMTIGAMQALAELDLRIPRDVAFTCFDDFEWAAFVEPRLTAVAQNVEDMASTAIDLLVSRVQGCDDPPRIQRTPTTYHHRTSCGCPPGR